MRNKKVLFAVQAAMIAALYVVLTYITNLLGLASGTIQVRFSEALCILPVFTPAAIPGLFIGCLISNLITGGIIWDIIFGSIATLLGALGTYFLRKKKFVYTLPPVIANIIIVPLVLRYGYGFTTPSVTGTTFAPAVMESPRNTTNFSCSFEVCFLIDGE